MSKATHRDAGESHNRPPLWSAWCSSIGSPTRIGASTGSGSSRWLTSVRVAMRAHAKYRSTHHCCYRRDTCDARYPHGAAA